MKKALTEIQMETYKTNLSFKYSKKVIPNLLQLLAYSMYPKEAFEILMGTYKHPHIKKTAYFPGRIGIGYFKYYNPLLNTVFFEHLGETVVSGWCLKDIEVKSKADFAFTQSISAEEASDVLGLLVSEFLNSYKLTSITIKDENPVELFVSLDYWKQHERKQEN